MINKNGTNKTIIQAPSINLLSIITSKADVVAIKPNKFTIDFQYQPSLFNFHQCRTIPNWDKLNAKNTPTAYKGISECVSPLKSTTNTHDKNASKIIPLEKD